MGWRFINDGFNSATTNMAIDEAIVQNHLENQVPTVRFYGWKPSAISIGYFQSLEEEVALERCDEFGVDYVRRITGGGAVFHDLELTYSFVCSEKSGIVSRNIQESYEKIGNSLIMGFDELGLKAQFVPLNDIAVNGKKISGNAQTRRNKCVLQHGTILLDVDVERMFSMLKVPDEKLKGKMIEDVKQRVTSVEHELDWENNFGEITVAGKIDEVVKAMMNGFEGNFGVNLVQDELSEKEKELAHKIEKERFSSKEWNFKR
ncbi:MAG: biotin/lipoate A/B protein ligase family protein [Candidatus Diapherotrites archaeon]